MTITCEYPPCRQPATIRIGFVGPTPTACFVCPVCFRQALLDYQRAGMIGQIVILPAHTPAAWKWHAEVNQNSNHGG